MMRTDEIMFYLALLLLHWCGSAYGYFCKNLTGVGIDDRHTKVPGDLYGHLCLADSRRSEKDKKNGSDVLI